MTNLILTVIGIVLAAIAALVAFDYGGDYFLEGYARAEATSISNAGNNVTAAYSVFGVQRRRPPANLQELTSSPQGRSLLKRFPEVQDLGVVRDQWLGLDRGAGTERAFIVEGVSLRVCRTLNQRLNAFADDAVVPGAPAFKSGCFAYNNTTVNVYYSFLGGVPEGGTLSPYSPITAGAPLPPPPTAGGGTGGADDDSAWPGLPEFDPTAPPVTPPGTPAPVVDGGWIECAADGAACVVPGEATVRYGVGTSYHYNTVTASVTCGSSSFGGDPLEGQTKTCSYRSIPQPDGWQFCANEGAVCEFGKRMQAEIRYGTLGSYVTKTMPTGRVCSTAYFSGDPAAGRQKACYYRNVEPQPLPPIVAEVPLDPTIGVSACTSGGIVGTSTVADPNGIVSTVLPQRMCRGDFVMSPGGRFRLGLQSDGVFALSYVETPNANALWYKGEAGGDVVRLDVQPDGNAVLYNGDNTARWASGTNGWRDASMRLSSDGNLTVYDSEGKRILFETLTDICRPRSVTGGAAEGGYGRAATFVPSRLCNNEYVDSPDGRFRLTMRADGNLALATGDLFEKDLWTSNTAGKGPYKLNVQQDGNSVLFGRDGNGKWSTGTNGWGGARMMVESDGNLTVRSSDGSRLLWETRTEVCLPSRVGDGRRTGDFGSNGTVVPSRLCNNEFVESPDGRFRLIMQDDGDLSLRMGEGYATQIWHSATTNAYKMDSQSDGNIVLYRRDGTAAWATGTNGWGGARMSLQNDGNLVVRSADNSRLIWETRSVYCLPAEKGAGVVKGDFGISGTKVGDRVCNNEYVTSPNGKFRLKMQADGDLALYTGENFDVRIWSAGQKDSYQLLRDGNGDWATFARDGGSRFRTGTSGWGGANLIVQDDGNLVVRSSDNTRLIWETRTVYCTPAEKGVGVRVGDFGIPGTVVGPRVCGSEYVTSPNGRFRLTMRTNGSLVLASGENYADAIWQSGASDAYALFQEGNGNWQTVGRDGGYRFRTQTWDWPGAVMMVQDDGNLVVRSSDNSRLIWETRTVACLAGEKGVGTIATEFGESGSLVGPRVCTNEYVTSPNGLFRLIMQPDGRLAVRTGDNYADVVWQSDASDAFGLFQEGNGNWQTLGRDGGYRFRTQTWDWPGARLIMQDDGNLVVRSSDNSRLIWETRTDHCLAREYNGGVDKDANNVPGTFMSARLCNNQYITSPNGRFRMTMRTDGNLVVGMGDGYKDVIWTSNSAGDGYKVVTEGNGNIQIVGRDGGYRWRTQTWDNGGARLMLNDLGNLVVQRTDRTLVWESRSDRCLPASISGGTVTSPQGMQASVMPFILCQNEWIDSPNGRFRFTLNANGNLQVLDGPNHDIQLWQSGTNDPNNYRFLAWADGNHWIMNRDGGNKWQTSTWDNRGARLLVQDDGNVAIYNGTRLIWQTNTGGKTGPSPGSIEDRANSMRAAGTKAVDGAKLVVRIPDALSDVGMKTSDIPAFGEFKYFYRAGEQLNFEVLLSGDDAQKICQVIATATGGTLSGTGRESTAAEGCASFNSGYYYWRRVDDAQAPIQTQFIRSFGQAVYDASAKATSAPGSLSDIGMAGAEVYNLLGSSGFEEAGKTTATRINWRIYIAVNSGAACRALDAAVGNAARTITASKGYLYTVPEGCGGSNGTYYYWKDINDAYDGAIAKKIMSMGSGASAAALSNGGELTDTGREAASSYLNAAAVDYGFITQTGVYQSGDHYTGEIAVSSGAACRRIDVLVGNGDRSAKFTYDPVKFVQGCGLSNGTFWYWRRLDQGITPGTVFDAKEMFSRDANDDPKGIWNYLEGNPTGGDDIALMNKAACEFGPCVRGDVDAAHVMNTGTTTSANGIDLDATTLNVHPGPDRDVIVRFRAPITGWYRVTGMFKVADARTSGIVADWGQGGFALDANTPRTSFNYTRRMTEGQTLPFRVNRAASYNSDSTQLNATMTYLGVNAPAATPSSGHRFWRVLASRSNGPYALVAATEIELRGAPGGPDLTDGAGGRPIASSSQGSNVVNNAFDNTVNGSMWQSNEGATYGLVNQWVGYDFGAGRNVEVAEVSWRAREDCCIDQTIGSGAVQWSDDGSNWSTSYNFVTEPVTSGGQTVLLKPVVASGDPNAHRYWRVKGYASNDPYMRSSELEMRETSGGVNVARFGIPMASSFYANSHHPYFVFNGTTQGSAWATSGGNGWIGVDLLVPRAINEFRYASAEGTKAPVDLAFEWSDDGSNWTQDWRQRFTAWGDTQLKTFTRPDPNAVPPPPVLADSIVLRSKAGTCIQVAELEAYSGAVNVALASNGGVASGSPSYDSQSNVGNVNDGVKPANYPNIFHSQCNGSDFVKVAFARPTAIDKLVVYGRGDCCNDRDNFTYTMFNGTDQVSQGNLDARVGGYVDETPVRDQVWSLAGEYASPAHFEFASSEGPLEKEGGSSTWWKKPGYQYWGVVSYGPTSVVMHPGPGVTQATIINFVAPASGSYSFIGSFRQAGCTGDGVVSGIGGFDPVTLAPCASRTFSFTRTMQAGEKLPFSISNNGSDSADSTEIVLDVRAL